MKSATDIAQAYPSICLGSAQFGASYGITNYQGKVLEAEVRRILDIANKIGISYIDTAQDYGCSEVILGKNMPDSCSFRLITKLSRNSEKSFMPSEINRWEASLEESFKHLGVRKIDSLLLHSPKDLEKNGSEYLISWLLSLKSRGLVNRLGVSIYSADDLLEIDPRILDIVQLPLSLLDQRLLQDGTLARLHETGVAVHARSIFLQGLLLTPVSCWPEWIDEDDRKTGEEIERLAVRLNCSVLDLCLAFIKDQPIESVVIGVCSGEQLLEIYSSWCSAIRLSKNELSGVKPGSVGLLDPRLWPR